MVTFIILIGVVAIIVYRFRQDLTKEYASIGWKVGPLKSRILPVPQAYRDVLEKYFPYYRQRDHFWQNKFAQKVLNFTY